MKKIKLGVIYGGLSTEHEVSINSAKSVIDNLDKDKYDIYKIYIDKKGEWYKEDNKIDNVFDYLRSLDVVFPVLHGLYGEDGTIQGLFELLGVPYVGCRVLASSLGMDKVYAKVIFDKANISQAKYIYIRPYNDEFIYVDNCFNEEICYIFVSEIKTNSIHLKIGTSMEPIINSQLPEFKVQAFQNGNFKTVTNEDVLGKWAIFFFYPADFTFVCPTELVDMAEKYEQFK